MENLITIPHTESINRLLVYFFGMLTVLLMTMFCTR